ncbi:MAG TPA: hypothetical protein VF669_23655 [Tepidisphaeraceae bacterium]
MDGDSDPKIDSASPAAVEALLEAEQSLRDYRGDDATNFWQSLDHAAYDLYGLSRRDRVLIEDMVGLTIDFQRTHEKSIALKSCSTESLKQYAEWLMRGIQPLFAAGSDLGLRAKIYNWKRAQGTAAPSRSLRVIEFAFEDNAHGEAEIVEVGDLDAALSRIEAGLHAELAEGLYTRRHLRIYDQNRFYILKPDHQRSWSRSAALNDADAVIADHLRGP